MSSHYAKISKSERLQKILSILKDCQPHTGKEIQRRTGSIAVHSDIHELRCNNIPIEPAVYYGVSSKGHKIYRYRMLAY